MRKALRNARPPAPSRNPARRARAPRRPAGGPRRVAPARRNRPGERRRVPLVDQRAGDAVARSLAPARRPWSPRPAWPIASASSAKFGRPSTLPASSCTDGTAMTSRRGHQTRDLVLRLRAEEPDDLAGAAGPRALGELVAQIARRRRSPAGAPARLAPERPAASIRYSKPFLRTRRPAVKTTGASPRPRARRVGRARRRMTARTARVSTPYGTVSVRAASRAERDRARAQIVAAGRDPRRARNTRTGRAPRRRVAARRRRRPIRAG